MDWIIVAAILGLIGFVLDREIYFYEGAHLGPRVQAWLYDRWARKYDDGKRASQQQDAEMLAQPLLAALQDIPEPFVLDFATGTGRLSQALLHEPGFMGRIIALDVSYGMLKQAADKLKGHTDRVEFLRHGSLPLPFRDATFDVICALEVLELFHDMEEPLREFTRLLHPGGILLTSRGTEESGRKAKIRSETQFRALLERNGYENVQITRWWKLFDRVMTKKQGSSRPSGQHGLAETMRCPACDQTHWRLSPGSLTCQKCGAQLRVTEEGIVLR